MDPADAAIRAAHAVLQVDTALAQQFVLAVADEHAVLFQYHVKPNAGPRVEIRRSMAEYPFAGGAYERIAAAVGRTGIDNVAHIAQDAGQARLALLYRAPLGSQHVEHGVETLAHINQFARPGRVDPYIELSTAESPGLPEQYA